MSNISRRKIDSQLPTQTGRYLFGFLATSQSSGRQYKISFDSAPGAMYWKCSCPGNIRHGQCKHLDACGLKGRKYGAQPLPTPQQAQAAQRALPGY